MVCCSSKAYVDWRLIGDNNQQNSIFSLTIEYGAGTADICGLEHAVNPSLVETWMERGYTEDPRIALVKAYKELKFTDIMEFYNQRVKGRPIAIGVVVNTKNIDKERLKKLGKVIELNPSDVFKY